MKKYKNLFIIINLLLLMLYFNYSVAKKESILAQGQLVLLELAPSDPRSLMQGDYMALRYSIAENDSIPQIDRRGYCVVKLDTHHVAQFIRFQADKTPVNKGEYLINYTSPNKWRIDLGAESYFFQEGHAAKYEQAKYGGLKIDKNGNSILVGLYNDKFDLIEASIK